IPNERSSHRIPTPRGGGVGIFVVVIGIFLLSRLFLGDMPIWTAATYCLSAAIVAVTGWLDDRHTLPAMIRLGAYSIAILIFILSVGFVNAVQIPSIPSALYLAAIPAGLLTFFWLVGFINAFNFMDGVDGLAGTQALIASGVWCLLFLTDGL